MIKEKNIAIPSLIRERLHELHDALGWEPDNQSIRNGTQVDLTFFDDVQIQDFLEVIRMETGKTFEPCCFAGVWSSRLPKGGLHVAHNHPEGWISGVVYIEVPENDSAKLCFDGMGVEIKPEAGKMVLFPSFLAHSVPEYKGLKPRLTIAFDMVKQ